MKRLFQQLIKFGVVGALATLIDFVLMVFLTECFSINPVISSSISFSISLVFNYVVSMRFVFMRRDDLSRTKEFIIFVFLSLVGLLLNSLIMWLGCSLLFFDYRFVKIVATVLVMVWNFVSRKVALDGNGPSK